MSKKYKVETQEFLTLLINHRFDGKFYYKVWKEQKVLKYLQKYQICTLTAGLELMIIHEKDKQEKMLKRHCLKYLREAKKMAANRENMEIEAAKREQAIERGRKEAMKRAHSQLVNSQGNSLSGNACCEMTDAKLRLQLIRAILEIEKRHMVSKIAPKEVTSKSTNKPAQQAKWFSRIWNISKSFFVKVSDKTDAARKKPNNS